VATAIGRYRIHRNDWYATHSPDSQRPKDYQRANEPRTLSNSIVRPWSWPAVLVFVRDWKPRGELGNQKVPSSLYLSDGRVAPTCVIQATPDESMPPPVPGPSQVSTLLDGGYSCLREHQGVTHLGTFGCLVYKNGTYYALTNRHVAGQGGEMVRAYVHGEYHAVGVCADIGLTRAPMQEIFPALSRKRALRKVTIGGYYPAIFSALDCASKILISTLLLPSHTSCAIIPIISP
jgi:hypothetical protein